MICTQPLMPNWDAWRSYDVCAARSHLQEKALKWKGPRMLVTTLGLEHTGHHLWAGDDSWASEHHSLVGKWVSEGHAHMMPITAWADVGYHVNGQRPDMEEAAVTIRHINDTAFAMWCDLAQAATLDHAKANRASLLYVPTTSYRTRSTRRVTRVASLWLSTI